MKISMLVGTGALLLIFGTAVPAYAQEHPDQQDEGKPPDTKPSTHDEKKAEPPKSPSDQPRPENKDARPPKEEKPNDAARNDKARQQDEKAQQQAQHHRGGQRIPDDKFKAHFGQEHHFHIGHPVMVGGRPRFAYGGYNFFIVQAWPSGWGYDDDVYIIDVDGVYYLVDAAHPGVQLELEVVL
ncbi:MAG: hypothetical protein WCA38_06325 [Candidatus Acidiferrales bacterium]